MIRHIGTKRKDATPISARLAARIKSYDEDRKTGTKIANTLRKPGSQNRKK
jgi:hypothetical protein